VVSMIDPGGEIVHRRRGGAGMRRALSSGMW
jgi:hypothetical protein